MKVSYNWLQEYLDEKLPSAEECVQALTMHAFEVEGVEEVGDDKVLDVKILPNRSHDCLSHYGIASELASILNLKRKDLLSKPTVPKTEKIKLVINTKSSDRAMMILVNNVEVGESPEWLKEKLSILGHRSINSVVDITNYLTFAFGQPMHAFDAGKIALNKKGQYEINIRDAKKDEKIKLLNGTEYTLTPTMMVISDNDKALDVAGVMGGFESRVTENTKDIILSFSGFDSVSIRKTAKALGIRTDASQRFENDISNTLIERVLPYALKLISEIAKGTVEGGIDVYIKLPERTIVSVTPEKISKVLGLTLDTQTILDILYRQNIEAVEVKGKIMVTAPFERLDLVIPEDIAEEVGRLYGLEKISPLPLTEEYVPEINPETYVTSVIRNALIGGEFSEIYTYAFINKGDIEIENPLAGDKAFLRKNLATGMEAALEHNFKFLDLLGVKEVKLFEIGKVFTKKAESLHLSIGVKYPKGKKTEFIDEQVAKVIHAVEKALGVSIGDISIVGGQAEIDLHKIIQDTRIPEKYPADLWKNKTKDIVYRTISPYPFAVRDVAVFVPNTVQQEKVEELIKNLLTDIVLRVSLFDKFVKEEKTSYAFRLVFQAGDRTLKDEEINAVMNPIYEALKSQECFEIR